jgi:hypothetical protein
MNKKALLKAILAVMGIVAYATLFIFACETHHPVLIALTVGPLILGGLIATGKAAYMYFDDDVNVTLTHIHYDNETKNHNQESTGTEAGTSTQADDLQG